MSRTNSVPFRLYMRVIVAAALLACVACGTQNVSDFQSTESTLQVSSAAQPEDTRIDRNVTGHPLMVHSAVFVQGTRADWPYVGVFLTDAPNICSQLNQGTLPAGMTNLALTFSGVDSHTLAIGSSLNEGQGLAAYAQNDAGCHNSLDASLSAGEAGSIEVEGLDMNGRLHGSFTVQLGAEGQSIAGTFVAVECPPAIKLFDCSSAFACR